MEQQFEIVEYDHSYAAAVADMWTRSGDSWGGSSVEMTAESVRLEEETSVHVNCLLAVAGGEVVGYCKLAKWTQDEGALYVEALNVRPDMHGKKIGKALVLRSVNRTAELGWARLDLDTWPGNTKAVPLYKKTGFFWEERDQEVYCVNFIPSILRNEIVRDYFERADWYLDSTREIVVKPDGREENKFTYFTYTWEKDGDHLSMEYARRGRGLRKVACNDFDIELTLENRDLVFGKDYEARFVFRNRTDRPLQVSIEGQDDKNIRFGFSYSGQVDRELAVTGRFTVGDIDKDQDDWQTHPRVCAEISIDGKSALFAVGIVPKFPARIRFVDPELPLLGSRKPLGFLDVESNLTEKADFTFNLDSHRGVTFPASPLECTLEAGQRTSIEVAVTVEESTVFSGFVRARAVTPSGEEIAFKREVGGLFVLPGSSYSGRRPEGDNERSAIVGLGSHMAGLKLERATHINGVSVSAIGRPGGVQYFPFQIGKPYDDEFIRTPPISVEVEEVAGGRRMDARYNSPRFPGIDITMHVSIDYSGVVRRWFSFLNTTDVAFEEGLYLNDKFRANVGQVTLPFDRKILEARTETPADCWTWDGDRLSENWFFGRNGENTIGLFWDTDANVTTGDWYLAAEHDLGTLAPGEIKISPLIAAAVGVFTTWHECRSVATGDRTNFPPVEESLEICVNEHNPFVRSPYSVELTEHKLKSFEGEIGVSGGEGSTVDQTKRFARTDGVKSACFQLDIVSQRVIEALDVTVDLVPTSYARRRVVFPIGAGDVNIESTTCEGFDTLVASNGCMEIRCAPDYAPGLLSCEYLGEEWLESGFPNFEPRDWWNPWVGGMMFFPGKLEARPLLREPATAAPADRTDSKGNRWKGMKITVRFGEHEDLRGLEYDQFYMMMPGVPVLIAQARIRQNTGTHFKSFNLVSEIWPGGTGRTGDVTLEFLNREQQPARVNSGHEEQSIHPESGILVTNQLRTHKMICYADRRRSSLLGDTEKNSATIRVRDSVTCADGEEKSVPARFMIFSDRWLDEEQLADFRYIDLFGDSRPKES